MTYRGKPVTTLSAWVEEQGFEITRYLTDTQDGRELNMLDVGVLLREALVATQYENIWNGLDSELRDIYTRLLTAAGAFGDP